MLKKTYLCILGLMLTGMLFVPVAAETGESGYWSFYIIDLIVADTDVKLNGHSDHGNYDYQKVYVSDSLDQVVVEFDVTLGPDTNLTITKDYIASFRSKHPDWEPALYANGYLLTYDVDAIMWWDPNLKRSCNSRQEEALSFYEHLRQRGAVHMKEEGGPYYHRYVKSCDLHTRNVMD